jgi:hypothetical protein
MIGRAIVISLLIAAAIATPQDPIEFGLTEVRRELHARGLEKLARGIRVSLTKLGKKESFRLAASPDGTVIEAPDPTGAMYGALELAERVHIFGKGAFEMPATAESPYLNDRGLNLFLTLPWDYANSRTDLDPVALTDPNRWWFHNENYWQALLDEMARDRLNWLDIHGTWDIDVTDAPNLYAYFIQSTNYPQVGPSAAIKATNLAQLNHVIDLAHARGIRVSLIGYQTYLKTPHNPNPPYQETEAVAYDYTREVVEKMIRQAPGLDAIGFRVGESGRTASFFNCYLEGIQNSGRNIPLITRSWITSKDQILPIARQSSDFTVEIKYNGEHWGAPYITTGGRVANWYSYAYEDYLNDSGTGTWAHTWPGNPTSEGGTWPEQPFKIVWQVRTNGTHRIFPFYSPDWVRRTVKTMKIGTASGFTVEPLNAYYPASPAYYLRNPSDAYTSWVADRDHMYAMLWGRLGYDPNTDESVFQQRLQDQFGAAAAPLATAWKAGTEIVARAFTGHSRGPDHRNQAPELEYGGDREEFVLNEPYDTLSYLSPGHFAALQALGAMDGRDPSMASRLRSLSQTAELSVVQAEALAPGAPQPLRLKELLTSIKMQSHVGRYFAGRFDDGFLWAMWMGSYNVPMEATAPLREAQSAWSLLSGSPESQYYKPFTEKLRMLSSAYHWSNQLSLVIGLASGNSDEWRPFAVPTHRDPPSTAVLSWREEAGSVVCTIPAAGISEAWLLEKPLPSTTYFHRRTMSLSPNGEFTLSFPRRNWGHVIAAEVAFREMTPGGGHVRAARIPSPEAGVPYLMVPSRRAPTPIVYNPLGAIWFLNPSNITPARHGLLLIGTGAQGFFSYAGLSDQRKILDPVNRGMRLIIMEQDFSRYRLDFLPAPPQWQSVSLNTFDPGGALGLPAVEAPGIIQQRFLPTAGWQVYGNGGIARYAYGAGEIWVVSARLVQKLYFPSAALAIATLVRANGNALPVVYVDGGEDYPSMGSSFLPDLMNALDVPFRSLNEVVADPNY